MNECDIFVSALEFDSPEERAAYLDEACGNAAELRKRLETLLDSHANSGSLLEHPAAEIAATQLLDDTAKNANERPADNSTVVGLDDGPLDFLEPSDQSDTLGRLGQYEVLQLIGRGGMGIVLRASDTRLNRIVAVKVLAPELAANATARKRFLREAQAAAAVSHDHVVTVYAVEENEPLKDGRRSANASLPYLVMEFIDGVSLQQRIDADGPLELKEILRIGRQIAAGLGAAHEQGLIHRDVKPSNILLQNGVERVQITDFGLARAIDDVSITRTGEVAGTPQYMSPEQAQGIPVDTRSDLFSLGSVLYAMCTGRSPFRAETTMATLRRVCDDTPRPIQEVNADISEWLVAIIDKLLEKEPADRFQTAAEVGDLLGKQLAHLQNPNTTLMPEKVIRAKPPVVKNDSGRHRLVVAASLLLLAVVGLSITEATGVTQLSATVIRIATGEGTLVIEVDDPTVEVSLDGEELSITGAGIKELKLRPGQYRFRATKNGQAVKQELVTISRGGRQMVKVRREPPPQATDSERDATHGDASVQTARLSPSEAVQHYSDVIRLRPDVAMAYVYRADAYRSKRDYEKAINDCTAALRIDPSLAGAFQKRGRVYYEMEAYPKAIADLNESIRLDPKNLLSYQTRGAAFFGMGRYEDALADVNKRIELVPNPFVTMMIRAQILVMSHRTKDYQQACGELLDRFSESKDPEVFCHAARTCVLAPNAIPNPAQAVELAARAVDLYPTGSYPRQWLLYTLGMAHLRAGSVDEASQCFHDSLKADPKWSAIALDWLGLALVEQRRGETEKARQWLGKAIESMEQCPPPHPQDRIEAELLRREVEQLFGQSGAASDGVPNRSAVAE